MTKALVGALGFAAIAAHPALTAASVAGLVVGLVAEVALIARSIRRPRLGAAR